MSVNRKRLQTCINVKQNCPYIKILFYTVNSSLSSENVSVLLAAAHNAQYTTSNDQ